MSTTPSAPFIDGRYNYVLPESQIAIAPAEPRDQCKLLVYKTATDELITDIFKNVGHYLPQESFLVMNNTRVAPARLYCSSSTKKRIEVFILINELQPGDELVRCMVDRKIIVGQNLTVADGVTFEVISQDRQYFMLRPNFAMTELPNVLSTYGTTPIPKYIHNTPLNEQDLRDKYQTVFAQNKAPGAVTHSAAAPTASLHFTQDLLKELREKNIEQLMVTLHVGLGTFAPITEENLKNKKLFNEYYEVSDSTSALIHQYKSENKKLVAVGTTAVRTLESFASTDSYQKNQGTAEGTDIFIFPPYEFALVDCLITNFHLPNSSLMMLVDALLQNKKSARSITEIYEFALQHDFKFYSFGDAMLIV